MVIQEKALATNQVNPLTSVGDAQNVIRANVMVDLGQLYGQLVVEIAAQTQAQLLLMVAEKWPETVLLMQRLEENRQRKRFQELARQWHGNTDAMSVSYYALADPAYQAILAERGPNTVKFILEDLQKNGGHWYGALEELAEEQPVTTRGSLEKARSAWLRWGKEQHLI